LPVLEYGAAWRHGIAGFGCAEGRSGPLDEFADTIVLDAVRIVMPKAEEVCEAFDPYKPE
jgi:hypothetical protein